MSAPSSGTSPLGPAIVDLRLVLTRDGRVRLLIEGQRCGEADGPDDLLHALLMALSCTAGDARSQLASLASIGGRAPAQDTPPSS